MSAFFLVALTTILTIVNPLGALAPYLAMTVSDSEEKKRHIAGVASMVCGGILAGCALAGSFIFRFYGITLPALKVAGGILLFFVAFDMINARMSRTRQTEEEETEGAAKEDVAVFPLAIPLLSGPGAIVSVFMLSDQAIGWLMQVSLYAAIFLNTVVVYFTLREAPRLIKVMGPIGMNVMSRLMGLMLAAIAIQFMIDGLRAAFPMLKLALL
jgi:multiple antibiotic resistance protein